MFHESQLILYAAAYLFGSIPFGLLLTKAAGKGDIRKVGSGNIGATNVLRFGGKKIALLTLLLDAGKGVAAVLAAKHFSEDPLVPFLAGLCVILGHCFPIWLKFKGGKGVATAFGVWFALALPLGLAASASWLLVFAISRYVSLAGIITAAFVPFYAEMLDIAPTVEPLFILAIIAVIIIYRHKSNISDLLAGTEYQFGKKYDNHTS